MNGKVCLVTGATSGIGFATARRIAAEGATVVLAGRTPSSSEAAAARLSAAAPRARVDWLAADLTRLSDVRQLAAEARTRYDRLDVLINNAGTIVRGRALTAEGVESTLAVNHLAPFLLTNLLLDLLIASAPARVVNVTSLAHERAQLDFDDLHFQRGFLPFRAYARSKLANLLFTYELARRLEGTGVTVNAANPGLVRTKLGRGNGALRDVAWLITHARHREVSLTADQGADTLVFLACSPAVDGITGRCFSDCRPVETSPASRDRDAARRLWALSEQWTGTTFVPDQTRGEVSRPGAPN